MGPFYMIQTPGKELLLRNKGTSHSKTPGKYAALRIILIKKIDHIQLVKDTILQQLRGFFQKNYESPYQGP